MVKTPQQLGRDYEKSLAKRLGIRPNKASGALWYRKGDVRSKGFVLEVKHTCSESFPLKDTTFDKARKECTAYQTPAMVVKTSGQEFLILEGDWIEDILEFIEGKMS